MGSTILPGASVRVSRSGEPRWGEVWAFCNEDSQIIIHRCCGRRGAEFRFCGDDEKRSDRPVPVSRLVGRVEAVAHPAGHRSLGALDRWTRGLLREVLIIGRALARRIYRSARRVK
ncbi:MAG: hypothetical protein KY393_04800 [Actinobacteria bacterium]|nr:hypothetical protein [Actinomycetota bacterium]